MEWLVEIRGNESDLEDLAKSFNSAELCIEKDKEGFVLKSIDFKLFKNTSDVRNKARELLPLINGAAMLHLDMRKPMTIGGVIRVKDDGRRDISLSPRPVSARTSVSGHIVVVTANGIVKEVDQADPVSSWVKIARNDRSVAKVLRLLSTGSYDWVNLYRIYEVIEKDVGDMDNITSKGWAAKKAIELFKRTACSPDAIGDEARHGIQKEEPPKDPMPFSKALSLIKAIVHRWLRSKSKES